MEKMDRRGIILNAAFLVSAGFVFTDHMAFTMAYMPEYLPAVTVGKLTAAVLSLVIAMPVCKKAFGAADGTSAEQNEN
jgi:ethanolamine transporter